MTREEIIALAKEAGFCYEDGRLNDGVETAADFFPELIRFANLIATAEREACARMCELLRPSKREYDHRFYDACTASAAVIRTRGEQ